MARVRITRPGIGPGMAGYGYGLPYSTRDKTLPEPRFPRVTFGKMFNESARSTTNKVYWELHIATECVLLVLVNSRARAKGLPRVGVQVVVLELRLGRPPMLPAVLTSQSSPGRPRRCLVANPRHGLSPSPCVVIFGRGLCTALRLGVPVLNRCREAPGIPSCCAGAAGSGTTPPSRLPAPANPLCGAAK